MVKINQHIANHLYQFSDLLEASGDNPYRVRAYRRAANTVINLEQPITKLIKNNLDLTSLAWIGPGIASTIRHILQTDQAPILRFNQDKTIPKPTKFLRLYHALPIIEGFINHLKEIPGIQQIATAGDLRRKKETMSQIEIVIEANNSLKIRDNLTHFNEIAAILSQSKSELSVQLRSGMQVNLHIVSKNSFGSALMYFTGSEQHLEAIIQYAADQHYTLLSKGLYKDKRYVAGKNEIEIYQHLHLPYIEPELREGKNEINAALNHVLPQLITLDDIKGDLHSHTNETDGQAPLEVMVEAAAQRGYEYFAITDHSKRLTITNGMDEKRLLNQIKQIDKLNAKLDHFLILKSMEVDILEDGSLDLSNDVLKELDVVLCSVHSKFKLPEEKQTERIIRAMDNPYFNILGHATGRLIRSRPPYSINMQRILYAAKERGCFIELNSQPYRLDINDEYCQLAKKIGVKVAISSDAHSVRGLKFMQWGIYQARRGWLEKADVINTYSWTELKMLLNRR